MRIIPYNSDLEFFVYTQIFLKKLCVRKRILYASTGIVRLAIAVNEHEDYSAGQNIYAFILTIKRTIKAP